MSMQLLAKAPLYEALDMVYKAKKAGYPAEIRNKETHRSMMSGTITTLYYVYVDLMEETWNTSDSPSEPS